MEMTLVMKITSMLRNSYVAPALSFVLFVLLASSPAHALVYSEVGDAGITVETAQYLPVETESVFGALHEDDGADVYGFVWGGGTFSADTIGSPFDTMLSIFDLSGNLLAFNDELNDSGSVSLVSSQLTAGNYLLGITYYDNNFEGDITGYSNIGFETPYQLNLSLAEPASVPEPVSLMLLAVGLIGLAFVRRKTISPHL